MNPPQLAGRWYDGRSSQAHEVVLEHVPGECVLRIVDAAGTAVEWPLAEIEIDNRLGDLPRVLRRRGHGQVECADSPLLAQWFVRPRSRVQAWADWLERRRAAIAAAVVVAVACAVLALKVGLPWLALQLAQRIPPAMEAQVSNQVVSLLERMQLQPSRLPPERQRQLRGRFAALVAGEPRYRQMRLRFARAPSLGANAFALPDGRIYLTDALAQLAGDDDELLAVLAHEAGHHVHRHGLRQAIESSAVVVAAGVAFGDVSGSSLAVAVPTVLLKSGYSRGHEREADAYALELLRRRGIDPSAFARIMRRLQAHSGAGQGIDGYLSTHPPTPERIRAAEAAARGP